MPGNVVRLGEARDRQRKIARAIVMHGTSPYREEAARLLAKLMHESGAFGAAYGWMDELESSVMAPVHAIAAAPYLRWDASLPQTITRAIDRGHDMTWSLMLRGVQEHDLERLRPQLSFVMGWFGGAERRDCPRVPDSILSGPYARFLGLLDAYRFVSFTIGRRTHIPFFRHEFRRALSAATVVEASGVVDVLGDLDALGPALLGFASALERQGQHAEAAGVYVILYELALLRCDPVLGVDAARNAGRAFRRLTDWDEATRWYGLARRIAQHEEDFGALAFVLVGIANASRERGDFPSARGSYLEAWRAAQVAGSPAAKAQAAHGLMIIERERGDLAAAARYGWVALQNQTDPRERVNLLLNLGTTLREAGALHSSERAYRVVAALADSPELRLMARDAIAYCAALAGDAGRYAELRPRGAHAAPYLRVQLGYFRGSAMRALGDARADRVLAAVERFARAHRLAEWEIKASLLRTEPPPHAQKAVEIPVEVERGLQELEASIV